MLQSILVYGFMIIALCLLLQVRVVTSNGVIRCRYSSDYTLRYSLAIGIFVFFMAVRWGVGIDHLGYVKDYQSMLNFGFIQREDMEPGFVWLMKMMAKVGFHFSIAFGLYAFIQAYCTFSYFKNEKYLLPYLSFLILTGNVFFIWCNIIRHAIVISVFLLLSRCMMKKRNLLLYLFVIALLSMIHYSALVLIPLYLVFYLDLEKFYIAGKVQYVLFLGALGLSSLSMWTYLMDYLDIVLSSIGYDRYSADLLLSIGSREMNFGARRYLFLIVDFVIIASSASLRETFKSKIFGFSYFLFMVYYTFMPMFIDNMAFSRLIDYFQIGRLLVASYLLFYLFQYKPVLKNVLLGVFVVLLFVVHLFIQIYADRGNNMDCVRYEFFWDN